MYLFEIITFPSTQNCYVYMDFKLMYGFQLIHCLLADIKKVYTLFLYKSTLKIYKQFVIKYKIKRRNNRAEIYVSFKIF